MNITMMEKIFASSNDKLAKSRHLRENDLFVGANGKLTHEKSTEDREDFSVPDFVKDKFGYDEDGNDESGVDLSKDDECTCPECGKSCDECECETVEGIENTEESSEGFDINTGDEGWLELNSLKDDEVLAKAIDLIAVNFDKEAAAEGGTDMDYQVIQVKDVTDKDEIREIINLIQGTLEASNYYVSNYRLNDGNLELKITF